MQIIRGYLHLLNAMRSQKMELRARAEPRRGGEGASAPLAPQKMTFKRATTLTLLSLIPLDMGKEKQKSIPTITNLYH